MRQARPDRVPGGATKQAANNEFARTLYKGEQARCVEQMNAKAVTAPIIGAIQFINLENAVDALAVGLSYKDTRILEAPYSPRATAGFV